MRIIPFALLSSLLLCLKISAQDASSILLGIKKLNVVGSVLYVAAHPDDENTRLLTCLSKEKNLRTGYISITRGDGGQNLVGKEQAELLGLIRTQELLAARKIDGAEQFFTRANDFGYSKNPEETFRIWGRDTILSDMVWVIRQFRPDVIICRFPTTGEGGHGHHTASAILAVEAFDAAADPSKFSWQLNHFSTWKTNRIYWNVFNPSGATVPAGHYKLDVGGFNPLLGKSNGEIAAESRSMHKSQGFGAAKTRGSNIEYFKLMKGDSISENIFDGIDFSWNRISEGKAFTKMIDEIVNSFQAEHPEKSLPSLIRFYESLKKLSEKDESARYWKKKKLQETESLIIACSGLWLEATASDYYSFPGGKVDITAQTICRNNAIVKLNKISWTAGDDTLISAGMQANVLSTYKHSFKLPASIKYSSPYWLDNPHGEGIFAVNDPLFTGKPESEPPLKISFDVSIGDLNLNVEQPVIYKSVDPIKGEIYRPFEILPQATVNFSSKSYTFQNGISSPVILQLKSNADNVSGTLRLNVPQGWKAVPDHFDFSGLKKGQEKECRTMVTPMGESLAARMTASINSEEISKSIHRIDHDHVPHQFMLSDALTNVLSFDLKTVGRNIGYIPGAGDEVAEKLTQVRYWVTELPEDVLAKTDLSQFEAIVTGIRAFNTNEWLKEYDQKLLEYVKQGGNLIIQYNTNSRVGPLMTKIFPYPFTISRDRVTDEHAEVRFLKPDHPALNYPNKISPEDFNGWIQERGIYFASDIDSSYEKIFSMNDPGEKPLEGSLIIAKYGKGNFVYTGLAFFRELPAGVPGAYRLFVNLLSLPKNNVDGKE